MRNFKIFSSTQKLNGEFSMHDGTSNMAVLQHAMEEHLLVTFSEQPDFGREFAVVKAVRIKTVKPFEAVVFADYDGCEQIHFLSEV